MKNNEEHYTSLGFFTRRNVKHKGIGQQLLEIIFKQYNEIAPEKYDRGNLWITIDDKDYGSILEDWNRFNNILMRREKRFESEIAFTMGYAASGKLNFMKYWVEEEYFKSPRRSERFLQLSISIYGILRPIYGKIHQTRDAIEMATVNDPRYGKTVVPTNLRKGLPNVYWANFFGPEYVEKIGKPKLATSPCFEIRDLSDGGMLLLTSSDPLNPSSEINRTKQKELRNHLGEELFYHWM